MLTDGAGVPLSLVVTGANRHDVAELENILKTAIVVAPKGKVKNLCADAGYAGKPALGIILSVGYVPHVRSRGEEKALLESNPDFHARRWVVEACVLSRGNPGKNQVASRVLSSGIPGNYHQPVLAV